jgi:hypothetical protein
VDDDRDTQRVVIELHRGTGPMTGRFLAEGHGRPEPFDGWLELLALLEAARAPAQETSSPSGTE